MLAVGGERIIQHQPTRVAPGPVPVVRREATASSTELLALQRRAGNRATAALVQRSGPADGAVVQRRSDAELLRGPLPPVGDPDRARALRLRVARGQKKRTEDKRWNSSYLGRVSNFLGITWSSPEDDNDVASSGDVGLADTESETEGGADLVEVPLGAEKAEEAEEPSAELAERLLAPFQPSQMELTIDAAKTERKGTRVGDVTARGRTAVTGSGVAKVGGKFGVEGSKGKVSGEGNLSDTGEKLEGDGKVEFVFGSTGERKSDTMHWSGGGAAVEAKGALEHFVGAKGGANLSGSYDKQTGALVAKAKAGGMVGLGTEGTVTIKLKAGDTQVVEAEGKLGLHFGAGGEIEGTIVWPGKGVVQLSTGGKLAFGPGVSYAFKITLNANAIPTMASGWLGSLWTWMTSVPEGMTEEDLWL